MKYDIPELDDAAQVLDNSARRIEQLLITERRLTSEVSHQLRTPLTALALLIDEISELAEDPQAVRAEAARASAQIDRLNQTMNELMAARRGTAITGPGEPLSKVLQPVIADVHPSLIAQGRKIQTEIPESLMADVPSGAVRHIASILLENAVLHGAGDVDLKVTHTGDWLVLSVSDQGQGLSEHAGEMLKGIDQEIVHEVESHHSESIGLALAMALAAAQGGRLEWRQSEPATLRVYLRSMSKNVFPISEESEDSSQANSNDVG
jgi:signal transduction histidine kinase